MPNGSYAGRCPWAKRTGGLVKQWDLLGSWALSEVMMQMRATASLLLTLALGGAALNAACALWLGASGCGAEGGGGEAAATDGCSQDPSFQGMTPQVHFKADVVPIFRAACGLSDACHHSESAPNPAQHFYGPSTSDPDPTPDQIHAIWAQSVSQPSIKNPTMMIVQPGDPASSFLLYKLDGDPTVSSIACAQLPCAAAQSCGEAMPPGGPSLPADVRDVVRRWIAQGAKND